MGNLKNLATGTVLTAPSPATSGTSLVLQSGEGARFPSTPFYAIAHPDGSYPTLDNAEIVQVTNISTDTLTIDRAELSTSAKSIAISWRISNPFLKEDYDDRQPLNSNLTTIAGLTPTTDNFMVATSSAWASRTPSQARTQMGLGAVALLATVAETNITLADNTTNNASTSAHGFLKKLSNTASEFMNGAGNWVNPVTVLSNPYKFRARRTSALSTSAGGEVLITFNTEDFDTNSNFDTATNIGRYTAPVAGFYCFNAYANVAGGTIILTLYKNGSAYQRGTQASSGGINSTWFVQSAASDYWEIKIFASATAAIDVNTGIQPFFEGFLVSIT